MSEQSTSYSGGIYCTNCGLQNPTWRSTCERCGTQLVHEKAKTSNGSIYCWSCGSQNSSASSTCTNCSATLMRPGTWVQTSGYGSSYSTGYSSTAAWPQDRPGCVTAYAIYVAIVSVLIVIGMCWLMSEPGYESQSVLLLITVGGAIYNAIEIVGIWQMKNWGRIMVVINMLLSIGIIVLQFCSGSVDMENSFALGQLIGIPISGYVAYWFYSKRELFD